MLNCFAEQTPTKAVAIVPVVEKEFNNWLSQQTEKVKNWVAVTAFKAKPASTCLIANEQGQLEQVIVGMCHADDTAVFGQLAVTLSKGIYEIKAACDPYLSALAWGLGAYQFTAYKKLPPYEAKLLIPANVDKTLLHAMVSSIYLVRDLVNTPTEDMGPADLAEAVCKVGEEFNASVQQIIGDELLKQNYPTIHTVGRASDHAPRLIDLRWGNPEHPKLTLVGKGVCFDTGGLNLKPSSGMALMKKDMGGAAHVLGLARVIMATKLPVCLRVLIPAVENSVSGDAYRPGDVIRTRKGITVEVTNTDAEGRLILCDALAEAVTEQPDLLLDFATLTGAAKVALGTEVAALFSNNDELANQFVQYGMQENDPIWRLPLYSPYRKLLDSRIADMVNSAAGAYGGAITAALFLKEFVPDTITWAHFDIMGWNVSAKPSRPEGADASGLRAVYRYLQDRFKGV